MEKARMILESSFTYNGTSRSKFEIQHSECGILESIQPYSRKILPLPGPLARLARGNLTSFTIHRSKC
jgi:hypothetical protein